MHRVGYASCCLRNNCKGIMYLRFTSDLTNTTTCIHLLSQTFHLLSYKYINIQYNIRILIPNYFRTVRIRSVFLLSIKLFRNIRKHYCISVGNNIHENYAEANSTTHSHLHAWYKFEINVLLTHSVC